MALSEEERSRLDALERSLMSPSTEDHLGMPEVERSARPDSQDPFEALTGHRSGVGADPFGPSGARRAGGGGQRRRGAAQIAVIVALVLAGVALYAVSVWSQIPWFGAGGFLLLIGAVAYALRSPGSGGMNRGGPSAGRGSFGARTGRSGSRDSTGRRSRSTRAPRDAGQRAQGASSDGSFMQRLEGRWDARRNERDR